MSPLWPRLMHHILHFYIIYTKSFKGWTSENIVQVESHLFTSERFRLLPQLHSFPPNQQKQSHDSGASSHLGSTVSASPPLKVTGTTAPQRQRVFSDFPRARRRTRWVARGVFQVRMAADRPPWARWYFQSLSPLWHDWKRNVRRERKVRVWRPVWRIS